MAVIVLALLPALARAAMPHAAQPGDTATTRIVSMVPNVTEFLFALGAGDQVVGTSDFCNYPPEARSKPRVGGLLNPSIEKIIAARPTDVIVLNSQGDIAAKVERLGVRVHTVRSDSLAEVYDSLHTIGSVTGRTAQASAMANDIRTRLGELSTSATGTARVRAMVVVGRQPATLQNIYLAGPKTYLGELLQAAGGANCAPESSQPYVPVTKEQIVERNPAIIIDTSLGEAGADANVAAAHTKAWEQLSVVDAVRNGRVVHLADPHLTVPGPGIVETAAKIAELLYTGARASDATGM